MLANQEPTIVVGDVERIEVFTLMPVSQGQIIFTICVAAFLSSVPTNIFRYHI
jgi:hypothetical protein